METKSNLDLWDKVKHVDQQYTKDSNVDGVKQTSISTLYPVKLMTEALGPIGELWCYEVVWEKFVDTAPVKVGKDILRDGDSIVWEQDHTIFLRVKTRKSTSEPFFTACEQYGHTKFRYMTGSGYLKVDHEYAKKSCSDALKKCLSLFGVCADVYMGDFDNLEYKTSVQDKLTVDKADKNTEEELSQLEEMSNELSDALNAFEKLPTQEAIKKVYIKKVRYFSARTSSTKLGDAANKYLRKLEEGKKASLKRLKENSDEAA